MTTEREEIMRYTVETVGGDELEVHETLTDATRSAVERLQQDPEVHALHVYEVGRTRPGGLPTGEHVKTITFAPDAHWNTEVVVLEPDEMIQPPSAPFICRPEDIDESGGRGTREPEWMYAADDPKNPAFHSVHADIWDNREKV